MRRCAFNGPAFSGPRVKAWATCCSAAILDQTSLKRRTPDSIAAATGGVIVVVLAVAGSLLLWGASFSRDYVHDELASQHGAFPPAAALRT